ncbi:hypothetical protein E1258_13235 [Micromonospora sp. KC207]|uniref:hypothetical protein n=1 Tax=Micromonospora sp. KC207 TaxID=2530377 RepID=UPI00104B8234|nr:hypothetical protein [Micromonospora sp. KC207]TDC60930.1 hypothetical protein E1258_13235 [Micromonospora sp. KC207]
MTIDVGHLSGERPVYAVAVDRHGRLSPMTQGSFTVSVMWSLSGRALDMNNWLPVEGATIRLEPVGIEVVTGSDGGFQFAVDPGLYTLTGTCAGPPSLSGSSQQLEVDGQGLDYELYLIPTFLELTTSTHRDEMVSLDGPGARSRGHCRAGSSRGRSVMDSRVRKRAARPASTSGRWRTRTPCPT